MYSILVVGAGYVGGEIAKYFHLKKQKVYALNRTESKQTHFHSLGVKTLQADLLQPRKIPAIPSAHFIVISLAPDTRTPESYKKIYIDAVQNFLDAIKDNPRPFMILYLSSTGVYSDSLEGILDEKTPPKPNTERGKILLEAEEQILASPYPSMIFRLAGIYGPARNRIKAVKAGDWPDPHADRVMNLIHRDDVVRAIPVLFNRGEEKQIYLGVDDQPVLESEFYPWLSSRLNRPIPQKILTTGNSQGKRYNNARLKSLGYEFIYPNYKKGYQSLHQEMEL